MKNIAIALMCVLGLGLNAQDLPAPSPSSTLEQRVGLTDIKIEYSRPGMKGRKIFGELVPFGELWRTGANKVPNITFSTSINFGGTLIDQGTYSLLTIPNQGGWTIILNSNTELYGTGEYDPKLDIVRLDVNTTEALETESFTIDVNNIGATSASIILRWEATQVEIPLEFEVHRQAMANIKEAIETAEDDNLWRVYRNSANYLYNNKIELDLALEYINKSVDLNGNNWFSVWSKSRIMAETKDYKGAIKTAKKAIKIGEEAAKEEGTDFGFSDRIATDIENWKNMKG